MWRGAACQRVERGLRSGGLLLQLATGLESAPWAPHLPKTAFRWYSRYSGLGPAASAGKANGWPS